MPRILRSGALLLILAVESEVKEAVATALSAGLAARRRRRSSSRTASATKPAADARAKFRDERFIRRSTGGDSRRRRAFGDVVESRAFGVVDGWLWCGWVCWVWVVLDSCHSCEKYEQVSSNPDCNGAGEVRFLRPLTDAHSTR